MRSIPALVCLSFIMMPYGLAHSQVTMTEESIKAFYKELELAQSQDSEKIVAFYNKHTTPDVKIVVNISKFVMGKEIEPEVLDMDKKNILERTGLAHKKGLPDEVKLDVISVDIANDARAAKVKENLYGKFLIKTADSQGVKEITAEQSMLCEDDLILSAEGVIQIKGSACKLRATVGSVSKQK